MIVQNGEYKFDPLRATPQVQNGEYKFDPLRATPQVLCPRSPPPSLAGSPYFLDIPTLPLVPPESSKESAAHLSSESPLAALNLSPESPQPRVPQPTVGCRLGAFLCPLTLGLFTSADREK